MPTINAFNLLEQTTLREMKTKLLHNDKLRIRKYDIKKRKEEFSLKNAHI
ncbi:hypothetical protein LSO9J_40084 [Candidatus Liberibacter solanacearum]